MIKTSVYHLSAPADNRPSSPLRIAFVSDVHDCSGRLNEDDIAMAIRDAGCDRILSGGDLISAKNGRYYMEHSFALLEKMCRIAPVVLAEGNHESRLREQPQRFPDVYRKYRNRAREAGAVCLVNESLEQSWNGMRITLSCWAPSLDYYDRFHPACPGEEQIVKQLGKAENGTFHILLSHHPDHFPTCAKWGADLTLAGHFHGGIFRFPLLGGLLGGSLKPFPKYDRGLFEENGHHLIVSAGLGLHTLPVRINNPYELVVVEIR